MKKTILIGIVAVFLVLFLLSCSTPQRVTGLSDLQVTACESADKGGTCFTKLVELRFVAPDMCCSKLGKCCGGS